MNSTFHGNESNIENRNGGSTEVRVVAALIRNENGDVLLTQRDPGRNNSTTFEFPGGKVEEGEDDEGALRRELREELGVDVKVKKPAVFQTVSRLGNRNVYLRIYRCVIKVGTPSPHDVKEFDWVPTRKILEKKIPDASMAFVRELAHGRVLDVADDEDDKDIDQEQEFPKAQVVRRIDPSKLGQK